MNTTALCELNKVSAAHPGSSTPALDTVTFACLPGEVIALLGPNGSGKSTLVSALLGLLPTITGQAQLFGTLVPRFRAWQRVGYVPQRPTAAPPISARVSEVVASGLLATSGNTVRTLTNAARQLLPTARKARQESIHDALDAVGAAHLMRRDISELSGGEHQRVLIARALVHDPQLLILDEPTVGVDAQSVRLLVETLTQRMNTHRGILLVTHEVGVFRELVTRSVVMRDGQIVYDGPLQRDLHTHETAHHPPDTEKAGAAWSF